VIIRDETPVDLPTIARVITDAFATIPYSDHTEARIVDGLRQAGALTVSLVAIEEDAVVGHVAFSPVTIGGENLGWFGLGPVSVRPDRQGQGIGQALVRAGMERIRALGASGSVVLGAPAYYVRFGYAVHPGLTYPGAADPSYFMGLSLAGETPCGAVRYHPAFGE